MAKKHVHRWMGIVGDATYGAACGGHRPFDPSKKCHARLTWHQIERRLNQRRPKYRKAVQNDIEDYLCTSDTPTTLYVKITKGR